MPAGENWIRVGTLLLGLFLLITGVGLAAVLLSIWPVVEAATQPNPTQRAWSIPGLWSWTLTPDTALLLLVIVVGGLGSSVHSATSFASYVGNRRLKLSWCWWYVLRIMTGAALAVLLYFVLRGGILAGNATSAEVNPYGIATVAGLAGLFSKQAVDKLREIFDTLLRVQAGTGDDERADKIALPVPALETSDPRTITTGAAGVQLTLTGRGFTTDSQVLARGTAPGVAATAPMELKPVDVEAEILHVTLPDELTANSGTIEITVLNPPPGGGSSAALTVSVG